jgi:filamentous hemagglutinin family protein
MNRHASMNRTYRLIWSAIRDIWIPVAERTRGRGSRATSMFIAAPLLLTASLVQAGGPSGGQVTAGSGSIAQSGTLTTITQQSPKLSLSWISFNIAPQDTVDFVQPSASAIAVNRIFDTNGTQILGHLNANGQVYLINPNGILFGPGAELNVGGLVATTLDFKGSSADGSTTSFSGNSASSVVNEGAINAAPGGYVALLASRVSNQGVISAQLGTVALAAGSAATLTFSENTLVRLQVDQSELQSLAENGGLIRADGGQVLMTAGAKDSLVASVVNNTGIIEARTIDTHDGSIILLGGMAAGTVKVGGTLDASAPNGGNGGFIETSAAHVEVADDARVTTAAASGQFGGWKIDPNDFTIAASGGDITGAALSSELAMTSVLMESSAGLTPGLGNINVNDAVAWGANTVLTLTASNNVNINANIVATGNTAGLVINPNTLNGGAAASGTGIYALQNGVSITLSGAAPSLSIAGSIYTVVNTLGAAGSMSGTDLQGINGGLAGQYALGSNIDASATSAWNAGTGFTPIGTLGTPFTGAFDGLGHAISSLTISLTTPNVALFGATGSGATIRNVGLLGGSVTGGAGTGGLVGNNGPGASISGTYSTSSVSGGAGTGGLVGSNTTGAISDSYSTGSVSGAAGTGGLIGSSTTGAVSDSYATGSVSGAAGTGGLIGSNTTGAISDSYATGSASGTAGTGGLVGSSTSAAISKSYATGSVNGAAGTGGLIGSNTSGAISDSYATGNVDGGTGAGVGGLIGSNTSGTVTNTYAAGGVSGTGAGVGALVGSSNVGVVTDSYWDNTTSLVQSSAGGGIGMTSAQMMTQANFVSATTANSPDNPSWDFASTWMMYEGLTDPLLSCFMTPLTVTANNTSRIYGQSNPAFGVSFSATPSGNLLGTVAYSGTAQTATNVGSYVIVPSGLYSNQGGYILSYANGTLTIGPATLTVTGQSAGGKVYDGTLNAVVTGGNLSGVIAGDTGVGDLNLTQAGNFVTKNVGSGIAVTASDSLGGTSAGNYTLAEPTGLTASITPASLTITGQSAGNKVYDGMLNAVLTGGTLSGVMTEDTGVGGLVLTQAGSFAAKSVGSGIVVTASDSVGGTSAGNYTLTEPTGLTASITPASLTITGQSAGNKVYDGTLNAVLTNGSLNGVMTGDTGVGDLVLTQAGSFVAKNVGSGVAVTVSDTVGGTSAGNYTLTEPTGLAASITPASLTITGESANNKVYDGSLNAVLTNGNLSGVMTGDTGVGDLMLMQSGSFAAKDVGSGISVTASDSLGGTSAGNYTLTEPTGLTASITPASLTVTGQNAGGKVYDGTLNAVLTGGSFSGVMTGDTGVGDLILTPAGSFVAKNVGSGIVVIASDTVGGTSAANYSLTEPTGLTANITPAMLTYTAAAASFTVGQTPSGLSGTLSGFVLADNQTNATAGTPVWTTAAAAGSQAGRYAIDGGGLTAANYVFVEAPGDAIALTLQSGGSPVIPPVIAPVTPPVIPVSPPEIVPVIPTANPPPSGPDAAMLAQAQTAAGTLVPVFTRDVTPAQSADSDQGAICSQVSSNGVVINKRVAINAMVASLRVVCGGVKLPDKVVEANAL